MDDARPPAVVLFDLGGVVCRFLPERRRALLAVASGLPEAEVSQRLAAGDFIHQADLGSYTAAEMRAELRTRLILAVPDAELDRLWAAAFEPEPEVMALVDTVARHTRTALLTDNPPLLHEALPHVLPAVAARFATCLFSYQFGICKPNAALFAGALARLGVAAATALFIDDNPTAVAGARAAGLPALRFTSAASLRVDLARWLPAIAGEPA